MAILFKVSAVSGKYKDAEGNDKNRYVEMGVVMETKNGPMLKLEAFPVGWDGWAYLNEPKPREEGRTQRNSAPASDDGEDLPF
jgi:hypothetical protein